MFAGVCLSLCLMLCPVQPIEEEVVSYSYEEELLCKCVEAEAGNQGYLGKCYVADVILNRVDSDNFPDSIEEVIYQKHQFEVVSSGMIDTVEVSEETRQAVDDELFERKNYEILYFRSGHYHGFGIRCFNHNNHYFSK